MYLIPEEFGIEGRKEYSTERSWLIGSIIGKGGTAVCYEAVCGKKTGILKEFAPYLGRNGDRVRMEDFLLPYHEIDRIRMENPEARIINNYLPPYEILYSFDSENGKKKEVFIWMPDPRKGMTLKDFLISDEFAGLSSRDSCILNMAISLTECVMVFHSVGLYDLDIKPSNLLVFFPSRNNMDSCMISLFDIDTIEICREYEESEKLRLGTIRAFKVTDGFSAPELYSGDGDYRSDIYSIGTVIYSALYSGRENGIETYKENAECADRIHRLEKGMEDVLMKTLNHNPNKRYDSCEDLLMDLRKQCQQR